MADLVKRLREPILADAFERKAIMDGALTERLIRERSEAADEIERLAARLQDREGWQPIETAPKDGTSILLFEPPELGRFVGYWNTPRQAFAAVLSVKERQPTHWQPLPQPPATDEQS